MLLLDVLFVLSEVVCVPPDALLVLLDALLPEVPWIVETRLLKSDCSVLRVLFVEEVESASEGSHHQSAAASMFSTWSAPSARAATRAAFSASRRVDASVRSVSSR